MRNNYKYYYKNIGHHMVENTMTYSVPLYMIWMVKRYLDRI